MKSVSIIVMICGLMFTGQFAIAANPENNRNQILLKSGVITTTENISGLVNESLQSGEIVQGRFYRIVQFNSVPDKSAKESMQAGGIRFLSYIPNNSYIISFPSNYDLHNLMSHNVRTMMKISPDMKLARALAEKNYPEYAISSIIKIDLVVQYFSDLSSTYVESEVRNSGCEIIASYPEYSQLHIRVNIEDINAISEKTFIKWMSPVAPPSSADDTKGRSLHRANYINADYSGGRHYDGRGVSISLADDGEVGPHIDFQGRLTNLLSTGPGGTHGDMTSGIAAGAGNLDPTKKGMGSGAWLYVHDVGAGPDGYDHIYNAPLYFTNYGAVITSTSYSQGCNDYDLYSSTGDQIVHDNPQMSLVFSAGNNGGGDCNYGAGSPWGTITGGFKQGKNVIACANLDAYEVLDNSSSRGPSADGRIKPDIASNGADQMSTDENNTYQVGGGTSAACPGIAGICSELYQAYRELTGNPNPESPLIKAVLLNSAEDIGNPGPDFTYGWGRVNALRALQTLEDNRYTMDSVDQGTSKTFSIQVPSGVNQLRAMVYWLDPQGDPLGTVALVNDLDMTVSIPAGSSVSPWVLDPSPNAGSLSANAVRGADHLNNVEQVTIDAPAAGNYTVHISGTTIPAGYQRYYIVWEFRTDAITLTYPNGGEGFVPGESEWLRWDAFGNSSTFNLEYSTDNGSTWITINSAVPANLRQYEWAIPSTVSDRVQLRISRGLQSDVTDANLSILGVPSNLTLDYVCIDTLQLSWTAAAGATGYEVSKLGTMFMDSIARTTATSIALPISQADDTWFSVKSIGTNGGAGRRAIAIHKAPGLQNCSFATDLAMVDLISPQDGNLFGCQNLGAVPVTVNLRNDGISIVNSFTISYTVNGGTPVTETYNGSIAHGAYLQYTFSTPVDFSVPGTYTFECSISYSGDQNPTNDLSQIQVVSASDATMPWSENFQSSFPPSGWSILSSGTTFSWAQSGSITGSDGNPTSAAWFDNYSYNNSGAIDFLNTMLVDMQAAGAPRMTFDVSYSVYSPYEDGLRVDISTDCGTTYVTTAYNKFGLALQTVATSNVDFTPSQASDWRNDTVDLTTWAHSLALLRFANINDFGNNLYIDNINIENDNVAGTGTLNKLSTLAAYPNPSTGAMQVKINNLPSSKLSLIVFDSQGRAVVNKSFANTSDAFTHNLDLKSFGKGIYFLRVTGDSKSYMLRLTII